MTASHDVLPDQLPFLRGESSAAYDALMADVSSRIAQRLASSEAPSTNTPQRELAERAAHLDLDGPGIGGQALLEELDELFLAEAVWYHHPAYLSHLNCPVDLNAVAAESVLAAVNTSVDTYDQSRIGTFIERRIVSWMTDRIGFARGDGVFTSGGTQSNLQALFLAREAALTGTSGPSRSVRQQQLVILTSPQSHFSIAKAALILGLRDDAVITVATDQAGRMDPAALRRALQDVAGDGRVPMAVAATAGTTDRGVIDPLEQLAEICRGQRVWLHVDAAYGCGLLASARHRHRLAGIEAARSVTLDFHKAWFQPVSSSALVVRDAADLGRGAWHADYLNPADGGEPNQVDKSLQTTRRFDALKLYATLRGAGPDAVGRAWDALLELTGEVRRHVEDHPELDLLATSDLTTVLFRWQPPGVSEQDADALVSLARQVLQESGRVMVARTVLDSRPCMKLTLLDPETTVEQVAESLEEVCACARILHRHRAGAPASLAEEVAS
ncbi:pyridoxal phosphate-dependent decarboxylase family protein [Nesterenkonia xinjiangensis]|uniref:L-2,4-diaminobutyrate decarboxylase n=1 Tax=Nesterenkonia xinjiangensis TaxID=225327 RepID=A0A7Z0GML5_9MICC|nr:pyridoxal-dependent decarboxylase [Nesterenkonia xinjiangensis]NYJ78767.1 L-2,4-diaminobutyrate decarboxylase [Nesterenkonia xinjiangensis]